MIKRIGQEVVDGSEITELVENKKVFSNFVDHKFRELDTDSDGRLSVKDLKPAVADIGAALGLPAQGTSKESDIIYEQVLAEFMHGNHENINKIEFKEVLSDFLLGMADGLKRDPVVILHLDGKYLHEFIQSPAFEPEMLSIVSENEVPEKTLRDDILNAFRKLTLDHGMPPASDPWVSSMIVEPALDVLGACIEQPVSFETFLNEFKVAAEHVVRNLQERPVVVAHIQNIFDGNGIKRLLSDMSALKRELDAALKSVPKVRHGRIPKKYLGMALDLLAASVGLPPLGAVGQMDDLMIRALKMVGAEDGKVVKEEDFKELLREVVGSIMLQLEGNPVCVSTNSVIHHQVAYSSTLLQP